MDKKIYISDNRVRQDKINNQRIAPDNRLDNKNKELEKKKEQEINRLVQIELRKRERRRKAIMSLSFIMGFCCLIYLFAYVFFQNRTEKVYNEWSKLKDQVQTNYQNSLPEVIVEDDKPLFTLDSKEKVVPDILDEYKNIYSKNKKLIGWLKIVDKTNDKDIFIDLPVMQTNDNEYYLTHNVQQEFDNNGTLFLDKSCDVIDRSDNFIIYGHQMKSGQMFGNLKKYEKYDFYSTHNTIYFDTIYEKGTYEVMYVFRTHIYTEDQIVFKYYEFIDANGEVEFNSYMREMSEMSFYDTGVTAQYGDKLLTLSTCDSQEENGRFVVVAKKIG